MRELVVVPIDQMSDAEIIRESSRREAAGEHLHAKELLLYPDKAAPRPRTQQRYSQRRRGVSRRGTGERS